MEENTHEKELKHIDFIIGEAKVLFNQQNILNRTLYTTFLERIKFHSKIDPSLRSGANSSHIQITIIQNATLQQHICLEGPYTVEKVLQAFNLTYATFEAGFTAGKEKAAIHVTRYLSSLIDSEIGSI